MTKAKEKLPEFGLALPYEGSALKKVLNAAFVLKFKDEEGVSKKEIKVPFSAMMAVAMGPMLASQARYVEKCKRLSHFVGTVVHGGSEWRVSYKWLSEKHQWWQARRAKQPAKLRAKSYSDLLRLIERGV